MKTEHVSYESIGIFLHATGLTRACSALKQGEAGSASEIGIRNFSEAAAYRLSSLFSHETLSQNFPETAVLSQR